jgi:hypothetical protein
MADRPLTNRDIQRALEVHYGLAATDPRAAAMAEEVSKLVAPPRHAAGSLPLEVDPFGFSAALEALKDR